MTSTTNEARVRRLINQTSSSETNFSSTMILELSNEARHIYALLLPESLIPNLIKTATISVVNGFAAIPSDFMRPLENPVVQIDSVIAKRIPSNERWRLQFLQSNANTQSSSTVKYYRETSAGIESYPSNANTILYEYIKKPTDLTTTDNTDFSPAVDDLVIHYCFEKLMGTERGDIEVAAYLANRNNMQLRSLKETGFDIEGAQFSKYGRPPRGNPGIVGVGG